MNIRFSELSKFDFSEALSYYENESTNLSTRFRDDIKQSIDRIKSFPTLYQKENDRVHKCVVSKFPYTIFYTLYQNTIYILAIANHYQNPKNYSDRFL